jgi:EmrB/QacA subfamily drug resistance transporter
MTDNMLSAEHQADHRQAVAPPDPRRWYALALLCLTFLVVVLGSTIVFTAAPTMSDALGFAADDVQWVFTASALTSGGLLFFGGRLADLLGRRRMFMTGVGAFTLSSMLCGLAWSEPTLIGARTVQGAAIAIMNPAALSLVATIFEPGPERNKALGIWSMLGGIGATAGLLVGGAVTDALGWRWVFFINLPVGLVVLALSPVLLRDSRDRARDRAFDAAGAATITAALVILVYAITQVPDAGWASAQTILLVAGSAALIALFAVVETRTIAPLLPLRILRSRALIGGNIIMLVAGLAVDGMLFTLTLYAQQVLGYSAVQFGLTLMVMTVASIAGSYGAQHVVTKTGFRPVAAASLTLIGAGCVLLSHVSVDGTFLADLLPGLLVFGVGMGGAFVSGSIASFAGVEQRDTGAASGLQNTSFTVGTALGVAILSTVATARTADLADSAAQDVALTAGYRSAFTAAVVVIIAGLVAAMTLSHTRSSAGGPHDSAGRSGDRPDPQLLPSLRDQ